LAVLLAVPTSAQQAGTRDPKGARTYRIQLRRGDTITVLQSEDRERLVLQIDSLQRELEGRGLTPEERARLSQHISIVVGSLGELGRSVELEAAIGRELSGAMARSARAIARASAEAFGNFGEAVPRGWIGIRAEGPHLQEVRGDSAFIRYLKYPEVVSVDPDSPAQRAGITRGDVLIAYNGADVRQREINVSRLLRPKQKITVTVRRDGDERIYPVVVSSATETLIRRRAYDPGGDVQMEPWRYDMPPSSQRFFVPRGDSGMTIGVQPRIFTFHASDGATPVFGARFVSIGSDNEELGSVFGVKSGVLVTSVVSGAARTAGVRGGDVIVRAAGRDVTSVPQFLHLLESLGDDRTVELDVVRKGKPLKMLLRW
jgi:serine protease Do